MRLPFKRAPDEAKSFDVLPEGIWQQLVAASDWGASIGLEQAVGLPAVMAVIRLISHAVGVVPFTVMREGGATSLSQQRAVDSWQWNLLHKRPAPAPSTPFNFKADLAANFCGRGNAYVRKIKPAAPSRRLTRDTPRVTQLQSLYAASVKPKLLSSGAVGFQDSTTDPPVMRGTDEIIHIRSFAVDKDGLMGVSPLTAARTFVEAGLKRTEFESRHLTNGIFPGIAVNFPRGMTEAQAGRWLDFIEQRHKGTGKAGKAIGVPDGAKLTSLPISLQDALFAQMTQLTVDQCCIMYQVPLALMSPELRRPVTDDDFRHFTSFALGPLLIAMKEAFEADDDLFEPGQDDDLSVTLDPDMLLQVDPLKKAQVQHQQIQDGTRLVDELRGQDGYNPLPPVPDDWTQHPGMVPQITPVGGAPNPTADPSVPPGDGGAKSAGASAPSTTVNFNDGAFRVDLPEQKVTLEAPITVEAPNPTVHVDNHIALKPVDKEIVRDEQGRPVRLKDVDDG